MPQEDSGTMEPLRKYVMDDGFGADLQELDDTVASVTDMPYLPPRRPETDETSIGALSNNTGGLFVSLDRYLIDNMQDLSMSTVTRSRSLNSRRSRLTTRSSSSRSRRGPSLERAVSQTILGTSSFREHFIEDPNAPTVDFILKDLMQADAVLASEIASVTSSSKTKNLLLPLMKAQSQDEYSNLLPPPPIEDNIEPDILPEQSACSWLPDNAWESSAWGTTDAAPDTLPDDAATSKASLVSKPRAAGLADDPPKKSFSMDDTSPTEADETTQTTSKSIFSQDPFTGTADFSGDPFAAAAQAKHPTFESNNEQSVLQTIEPREEEEREEWTSFGKNEFHRTDSSSQAFDSGSHDSPASVADFGMFFN